MTDRNEYDDLIEAQGVEPLPLVQPATRGEPEPERNEYDDMLGLEELHRKSVMFDAVQHPPDTFAEATRLSRTTGLPADMVMRNLDEVRKRVAFDKIQADAALSPGLKAMLSNPRLAPLAHDDTEALTLLESTVAGFKRGTARLSQTGSTMNAIGRTRDLQAMDQVEKMLADGVSPWAITQEQDQYGYRFMSKEQRDLVRSNLLGRIAGSAENIGEQQRFLDTTQVDKDVQAALQSKTMSEFWTHFSKDPVKFIATVGTESLPSSAPGVIAGLVGGPVAGAGGFAAAMGANSAVVEYTATIVKLMRDKNVNLNDAEAISKAIADPEFMDAINKTARRRAAAVASFDALSGGIAGKAFSKSPLLNVAIQMPVQGSLGAAGEVAGSLAEGKQVSEIGAGEVMAEFFGEMFTAPVDVATATIATRQQRNAARIEESSLRIRELQRLATKAADSKLKQRDPQSFSDFIQQAAERNGEEADSVYIDANALQNALNQSEVDPTSIPGVAEQLADAVELDMPVRVDVGDYAAHIAGTDMESALASDIKVSPDDLTVNEQKAVADVDQAEFDAALAGDDNQVAASALYQQEADNIQTNITNQIKATKRFRDDVADAYGSLVSNFYRVTAARLNMTPQQLFDQSPLGVTSSNLAGDTLNQQAQFEPVELAENDQFATGRPVTFAFVHNTNSATKEFGLPEQGDRFGRDLEPSARYVVPVSKVRTDLPDGEVSGELTFNNPLVLGADWKQTLSDKYGKSGKELSKALIADGYDGVVTLDRRGNPSETVDLTTFDEAKALYQGDTGNRGAYLPDQNLIALLENADLTTFLHETGHAFLTMLEQLAPQSPELQQDMDVLLDWFGVESMEAWQAMTLEQKREHHEKFARGFEQYLGEGKAPSPQLHGLFRRFSAWVKAVYRQLRSLNVSLTDEVRGVMDRLIASEDEIQQMKAGYDGYVQAFDTIEESGMTPAQWEAYQRLARQSSDAAIEELEQRSVRDMQWLANARNRIIKALQKKNRDQRQAVEDEVRAEVQQRPEYAVQRALKRGEIVDSQGDVVPFEGGKIATDSIAELYPGGEVKPLDLRGMTRQDGVHPDVIAPLFGFTSGDHMIQAILEAESLQDVVRRETDNLMLERYGDLNSERSIADAANSALANEARARLVAAEARALDKAAGGSARKDLLAAAKRQAIDVIGKKIIGVLRPVEYRTAANAAARSAKKNTGKDTAAAARFKRNQLVHEQMHRQALQAKQRVAAGLKYLRKFGKAGTRKNIDPDFLDQIDVMLDRFDIKQRSQREVRRRESLDAWVKEKEAAGEITPDIDDRLLDEARRQHYSRLTVSEFDGLIDSIKSLEHVGRLKSKLLAAQDQRNFEALEAELVKSIMNNARNPKPVPVEENGFIGRLKSRGREFMAIHRKASSIARHLDGWKDGGAFWRAFIAPLNRAGDIEATMNAEASEQLARIMKPLHHVAGHKQYIAAIGDSLSLEARIAIALNWGNETNRQRVRDGDGWTDYQVGQILETLTSEQWDAIQGVWDYLDTYWSQIAEKQRRLTGVTPERVQAAEVVLSDGRVLRGGYYPLKYDTRRSDRAESNDMAQAASDMMKGAFTRATTRRGHTKQRLDNVRMPVRKDLGVIDQHVREVIHDLTHHETLIDVNRILGSEQVSEAIRTAQNPEILRTLKDLVQAIAAGDIPARNAAESILNHLRSGATVAGLGYNVATMLLQPTGLFQSAVRIGPQWVLKGMMRWMGDAAHMNNTLSFIHERSEFMKNRDRTLQREVNEIVNQVRSTAPAYQMVQASFFYGIQKLQLIADIPTWAGQYEKTMSQTGNETLAIQLADQAVIDAQASGQIKDLAAIQRGSPAWKLFTNFYSFFSAMFNVGYESVAKTNPRNPLSLLRLMGDYLMLVSMPAIAGELIKALGKGEDIDDEEQLRKLLINSQVSYLTGTMIGVREIGSAIQGFQGYSGPAGLRFFGEISKLYTQAAQGEPDKALFKALGNTLGVVLHMPSGQVIRSAEGLNALAEGDTRNPAALLFGPPKQ